MPQELLRQVRALDPRSQMDQVVDVLIGEGRIQAISPTLAEIPADTQIREGQGCILAPGLVDLYSYSGEPGFESRETLQSLVEAAIAGGFTRLTLLPDTQPPLDHPDAVTGLYNRISQAPIRLQVWGALTQNLAGQQLTELSELGATGIVGWSDGQPLMNGVLLRRALEYLGCLGQPVALWPCDRTLAGSGVVREGVQALQAGVPSSPVFAETSPLAALLEIVAIIQTPVHIMRVSTARSVDLIAAAKAQGIPITASTTWMHLLWNSEAVHTYDVNLRLDPPLGNPADQEALIRGLETGVLDAIALDHRAYTYEEKTVALAEAPPGAIGLELALPLLWQTFVASQRWSALDLWRRLSLQPAECLQQIPPILAVDQPTELILFDPEISWTVTTATLKTRGANTPWLGQTIKGKVLQTLCAAQPTTYQNVFVNP